MAWSADCAKAQEYAWPNDTGIHVYKVDKQVPKLQNSIIPILFVKSYFKNIYISFAMVWMFVYPSNSYIEILTPKVLVLGGVTFGKWLGHKGRALMNGINVLIKEAPERSLALSAIRGNSKKTLSMNQTARPH